MGTHRGHPPPSLRWCRDSWTEEHKLVASDASGTDNFGFSVALQGDRALIGAHLVGDAAFQAGAVYVFERVGGVWIEMAKLLSPNGARTYAFGSSVALDGDRALIGEPGQHSESLRAGAVYVFEGSAGSWSLSQTLTPADGGEGDRFGASVSLDGTRALIGSPRNDTVDNNDEGSTYVFDLSGGTWTQTQRLTASDAIPGDWFGISVSLDGDRALVGTAQGGANDDGSAYMFDLSNGTWSETQKLTASDAMAFDYFGRSVSLDGDRALIGAYGDDPGTGGNYGSAYVFDLSNGTWSETAKLTPSNSESTDWFGYAVTLEEDRALIGDWADNTDRADRAGSAYVFDLVEGAWRESLQLEASDAVQADLLGISVSLDGDHALVGAHSADLGVEIDAGAAYIYTVPDPVTADPPVGEEPLWVSQVWPNPASQTATLELRLQRAGMAHVMVFDTRGRTVREMQPSFPSGVSKLDVPTDGLAPGAYGIRIEVSGETATRRLNVVR